MILLDQMLRFMTIEELIETPIDPRKIPGLIAEDRYRTTNRFVRGNIIEFPASPIDISAEADLLQRRPTHFKIKKMHIPKTAEEWKQHRKEDEAGIPYCLRKDYEIDMACAYPFWRLHGDHRIAIMLYYEQTRIDEKGVKFITMCFVELVEIMITEETFDYLRGTATTATEIGRIKSNLLSWKPRFGPDQEGAARKQEKKIQKDYADITDEINNRPGAGVVTLGHHINLKVNEKTGIFTANNKRIQPRLPLAKTIKFARNVDIGEGPGKYINKSFPGAKVEDMVTIYHADCHGLPLPWLTRAESATKPADGADPLPRINEPKVERLPDRLPGGDKKNDEYADMLLSSNHATKVPIVGGMLAIFKHLDPDLPAEGQSVKQMMRSIYLEQSDDELLLNVRLICQTFAAAYVKEGPCWFANYKQTTEIVAALSPHAPSGTELDAATLKMISAGRGYFRTHTGQYLFQRMNDGRFYLAPNCPYEKQLKILERRLSLALHVSGFARAKPPSVTISEKNGKFAWYVDAAAMENVVKAIIDYTDIEVRKPTPAIKVPVAA